MAKSIELDNEMYINAKSISFEQKALTELIGTDEKDGFCKLPNGLVLCWGCESASTFWADSGNGGYRKALILPYKYKKFALPVISTQYPMGFAYANVHSIDLINLRLGCTVNLEHFYINWFVIGI